MDALRNQWRDKSTRAYGALPALYLTW
jgi:hypothetical protein